MTSLVTCALTHAFPWPYSRLSWSTHGHLCCPGCGADLDATWGIRSGYSAKSAYKHAQLAT